MNTNDTLSELWAILHKTKHTLTRNSNVFLHEAIDVLIELLKPYADAWVLDDKE